MNFNFLCVWQATNEQLRKDAIRRRLAESAASAAAPVGYAAANDYYTKDEMAQFVKPKKKKVLFQAHRPVPLSVSLSLVRNMFRSLWCLGRRG